MRETPSLEKGSGSSSFQEQKTSFSALIATSSLFFCP